MDMQDVERVTLLEETIRNLRQCIEDAAKIPELVATHRHTVEAMLRTATRSRQVVQ